MLALVRLENMRSGVRKVDNQSLVWASEAFAEDLRISYSLPKVPCPGMTFWFVLLTIYHMTANCNSLLVGIA